MYTAKRDPTSKQTTTTTTEKKKKLVVYRKRDQDDKLLNVSYLTLPLLSLFRPFFFFFFVLFRKIAALTISQTTLTFLLLTSPVLFS